MAVLSAANSPLVVGSTGNAMTSNNTEWVRVVRAFFVGKDAMPVGAIIKIPRHVAASAITAGKAVAVDPPAPPAAPADAIEPAHKKSRR